MPASYGLAVLVDNEKFRRRTRGFMGITYVAVPSLIGWIIQSIWVSQNMLNRHADSPAVDWTDGSKFGLPFAVYVFFGIEYACWQITCQYILATLTNDPQLLARYSGVFRAGIAAGECVSFGIDSTLLSFKTEVIVYFTLSAIGIIILYSVCYWKTTETNYFAEENVIVPLQVVKNVRGIRPEIQDGEPVFMEEIAD